MSSKIFFLAYASSAATPCSPQELAQILGTSRVNNAKVGLTGMLLYRGGNFLQSLEGNEDEVKSTMLRISRDQRHRSLVPLYEGFQTERLFAEWSMGFEDVTGLDSSTLQGLNSYLTRSGDAERDAAEDHDVFEFFRAFRDHIR